MILKKYTRLNVGQALLYSDFLICVSSFLTFGVEIGLFSLLGLFAKAFLVDGIIDNINSCKYFMVITEMPEEVSAFVIKELNHSVTTHKVVGGFSGNDKTMIHTVCHRMDAIRLRKKVKEIEKESKMEPSKIIKRRWGMLAVGVVTMLFAGIRFAFAGILTILICSIIDKKFLYPKN